MISGHTVHETAPLGSLIRFANGEPRPPERFKRKLSDWEGKNGTGWLIERSPSRYGSPASFTLRLGNLERDGVVVVVMQRVFMAGSAERFEIVETPQPGSVRVVTGPVGNSTLHYLAPNLASAEQWIATKGYSNMRAEVVGDDGSEAPDDLTARTA